MVCAGLDKRASGGAHPPTERLEPAARFGYPDPMGRQRFRHWGPLLAVAIALGSCASTADIARAKAVTEAVAPSHPFPESAFLVSDGLKLHYRHWTPDRTPVGRIFLLHGFGASTFSFRFLVPRLLTAGWEVAAVDIPPFGYSDKTDAIARLGYDRGRLLWAVPDALGWTGPTVLLGHSMGGLYATAMTERNPERVSGLVYLAGAVPVDGNASGGAPWFAGLFAGALDSSVHNWSWVKDSLKGFAGAEVPDAMVDGYFAPLQVPGGVQALLDWSVASGRQAPVHPKTLKKPALLVWGEKDTVVPLETGRRLAGAICGSTLVVLPGLGHLAHELQSEAVHAVVMGFLAQMAQ